MNGRNRKREALEAEPRQVSGGKKRKRKPTEKEIWMVGRKWSLDGRKRAESGVERQTGDGQMQRGEKNNETTYAD